MNLKAIFTTILVVCSITFSNAQSKELLAKSAMLNADEAYTNGQYSECIDYLNDVVTNLGKTNSRIQYLKVKSLLAMGTTDKYNKTIWLQADTALKVFFEVTPENGYVPEKYEEMIMAVSKIKKYITSSVEATSGLNPEMIFVQGGTFQMGCNDGNNNEKPVHTVAVGDFYIQKYEITKKQWFEIMKTVSLSASENQDCIDCPVGYHLSWDKIQEFISKLNQITGKTYRLPTEAEWEYAARGGNKSKGYMYSGSNSLDDVAWYKENSGSKTHAVGQKQANELGLYDMTGNMEELCSDWFWFDINGYQSEPVSNPKGPSSGAFHVARGGGRYSNTDMCRVTHRSTAVTIDDDPYFRLPVGFRLVLIP